MTFAGIDLGTTHSAIAYINAEGIPALAPDAQVAGQFRTPSLVHLGESGCFVGADVSGMPDEDQSTVARHSKLHLATTKPMVQDNLGLNWSASAINALILSKLRNDLQADTLEEMGRAVIAVPSQFGDTQRRAVRRAAELAGIAVHSLVDESVAAATYLTKDEDREQTILVYDLGGGTFDATVLRSSSESLSVLATEGDSQIGGKWIDELIMQAMTESLMNQCGHEIPPSPEFQSQLLRLAIETNTKLSRSKLSQVRLRTVIGNEPFDFVLARDHFESLIDPMLQRSVEIIETTLKSAELGWKDLDQIFLVGGSTQIPAVKKTLAKQLGGASTKIVSRQPQDAVAFGAAMLAESATDRQGLGTTTLRQSIAGYDLGVRIRNPRTGKMAVYNLMKRNSLLPTQGNKVFRTSRDDQTRMTFEVVQSKGDPASALSLGTFSFGPIAEPRANYPIEVTMQYDEEGIVSLRAKDAESGREISHSLNLESDAAIDEFDTEKVLVESVITSELTSLF